MIQEIINQIIKELGPTGLLICGLYFLLGKHIQNISKHIETINEELGQIKNILREGVEKLNLK
jgi:hypothetical protein